MIYSMQTNIGNIRECNEDSYITFINAEKDMCFFIVADGMGGYNGGDIASKMVVDSLKQSFESLKLSDAKDSDNGVEYYIRDRLLEGINKANQEVIDYAQTNQGLDGMGTTVVIACIAEGSVYYAHVGDSRLYFANKDRVHQLTTDHSYVEELVKNGIITREQTKDYPQKNIITMALGSEENFAPDFASKKLSRGDVLLMCTDGLSNKIDNEELYEYMKSLMATELDQNSVEETAANLIDVALERGGEDNITVGLVVY